MISFHFSGNLSANYGYGSFTYNLISSYVAKNGVKFSLKVFLSDLAKAS